MKINVPAKRLSNYREEGVTQSVMELIVFPPVMWFNDSIMAATKKKTTRATEEPKEEQGRTEETFHVKGEQLLSKVKELIKEGNVRRIIIKDKTGKTLIEFPLTIGVIGAVFAPVLAAVGAIAALVSECSITVEREK